MASDAEEVEGLGRVLTRLALTEDDKLEQVGVHCSAAAADTTTTARRCSVHGR